MLASQVFNLPKTFSHSTKSSSAECTSYHNYNNSKIWYRPDWITKSLIKPALVLCIWQSKNYKKQTCGLKKLESYNYKKAWKRLIKYSTTKIVRSELISNYHNDLLTDYFGVNKIRELISQKYYWLSQKKNVKSYMKRCDVCLTSKAVKHKPYGDLQSFFLPTHW